MEDKRKAVVLVSYLEKFFGVSYISGVTDLVSRETFQDILEQKSEKEISEDCMALGKEKIRNPKTFLKRLLMRGKDRDTLLYDIDSKEALVSSSFSLSQKKPKEKFALPFEKLTRISMEQLGMEKGQKIHLSEGYSLGGEDEEGCDECFQGWKPIIQEGYKRMVPCDCRKKRGFSSLFQTRINDLLNRHHLGPKGKLARASMTTWGQGFAPGIFRPRKEQLWLDSYLSSLRKGNRKGLYFYGVRGCGKSWSASYLHRAMTSEKIMNSAYVHYPRLLSAFRRLFQDAQEASRLKEVLFRVPFLVLDDLGMEQQFERRPESIWSNTIFFEIIDYRFESEKITVFTSSIRPGALRERVGEASVSRIRGMTTVVAYPERDLRANDTMDRFWQSEEPEKISD